MEVRRADGSLGVKMKDLKITANSYREFNSMIETCADNDEDNHWCGLWTALDNAGRVNNSYNSARTVVLDNDQLSMFIHFLQTHIEYLQFVTIGDMNRDGAYKEANGVRYTIKGLTKLYDSLTTELAVA